MYSSSGVFCFSRMSSSGLQSFHPLIELTDGLRHCFEETVEEGTADDGRGAEHCFQLFIETVDPGHDHPLDGIGDGEGLEGGGGFPMITFTEHRLPVDEGAHDLFEEEGIPLCLLEDDLPHPAGEVLDLEEVVHQLGGFRGGEGIEADLRVAPLIVPERGLPGGGRQGRYISGLLTPQTRIGTRLMRGKRCSIKRVDDSSAQWRSSKTRTRGPVLARRSKKRREER